MTNDELRKLAMDATPDIERFQIDHLLMQLNHLADAQKEKDDPLNVTSNMPLSGLSKAEYLAAKRVFEFIDLHRCYNGGGELRAAGLINICLKAKESTALLDRIAELEAAINPPSHYSLHLDANDLKAAEAHCDWMAFKHAWNAVHNKRRATEALKGEL